MKNLEKDFVMRRLANEMVTFMNDQNLSKAVITAEVLHDTYLWDSDFDENDLDVVQVLLDLYKLTQLIFRNLDVLKRQRELLGQPPLRLGPNNPQPVYEGKKNFVLPPTQFDTNYFNEEWNDTDFLIHIPSIGESPNHTCKLTWLASLPYVRSYSNAIDVGCREGAYSRYLHNNFKHTYCFDARKIEHFSYNVDLAKVTHFTCALGDETTEIVMSGGTHQQIEGHTWTTPCYRLDEFNLKDVDYIKIDVEGFEEKVIRGGLKTIEASWPLIVIEQNEVCLPGDDQFAAKYFLESLGYEHVATAPNDMDLIMQKK